MALETLLSTNGLVEAQLIRARLGAAGIQAHIPDEGMGAIEWGAVPALGGIRVQVASADLPAALRIIAQEQTEDPGYASSSSPDASGVDAADGRERQGPGAQPAEHMTDPILPWDWLALGCACLGLVFPLVLLVAVYAYLRAHAGGVSRTRSRRLRLVALLLLVSLGNWLVRLLTGASGA